MLRQGGARGPVVIDFIGEISPCFAEMVNGFRFMAILFVKVANGLRINGCPFWLGDSRIDVARLQ